MDPDRGEFSWANHLWWLATQSMPLGLLHLMAMIFEFDNGPLEIWWMGRHMEYPWSQCVEHHRRRLVRADGVRLPARIVAKLSLITIGPLLKISSHLSILFLDWDHSRAVNGLLFSWGRTGAIRGVPE